VIHRNGYKYTLDSNRRPIKVEGWLTSNKSHGRNPGAQLAAGGKHRLHDDEGGHYVARIFNGPTDDFNHFAQNQNFNRGRYKALENRWQKLLDEGKSVHVSIKPSYPGDSLRPNKLTIVYTVDGQNVTHSFRNFPGGK